MEKYYNEKGEVAVLVSPGYGAGWSTWASTDHAEFAAFDRGLVELALKKASTGEVREYVETALGPDAYFYCGGWDQIEVMWLGQGQKFIIEEYDGNESVTFYSSLPLLTA